METDDLLRVCAMFDVKLWSMVKSISDKNHVQWKASGSVICGDRSEVVESGWKESPNAALSFVSVRSVSILEWAKKYPQMCGGHDGN